MRRNRFDSDGCQPKDTIIFILEGQDEWLYCWGIFDQENSNCCIHSDADIFILRLHIHFQFKSKRNAIKTDKNQMNNISLEEE